MSLGSNKDTLKKKKISAICFVAICSRFLKHNEKHSRVSNRRKRKSWVKPWLAGKHKSLYHGLFSELLLHDKEEFKMFLGINTETYEVIKFVLISRCLTRWRSGAGLTDPKSGQKMFSLILILKHWSTEPTQNRNASEMYFLRHLEKSVGGACRTH